MNRIERIEAIGTAWQTIYHCRDVIERNALAVLVDDVLARFPEALGIELECSDQGDWMMVVGVAGFGAPLAQRADLYEDEDEDWLELTNDVAMNLDAERGRDWMTYLVDGLTRGGVGTLDIAKIVEAGL